MPIRVGFLYLVRIAILKSNDEAYKSTESFPFWLFLVIIEVIVLQEGRGGIEVGFLVFDFLIIVDDTAPIFVFRTIYHGECTAT